MLPNGTIRKCFAALIVAFAAVAISSSARASLMDKLEWKTEKYFGKATLEQVRDEYGFIENPLLSDYVSKLGVTLASNSERTDIPYEFHVVDTGEVNAFAAPGGFVFVTRGLLDEIDTDDELASVVGHEVGHVAAHHGAKNIKKLPFIIVGMSILAKTEGETVARIGGVALQLLQLHYSREDEYQADQLGVKYSFNSGYDPDAMVSFFQKLEKKDRTGDLTKLDVSLMSHPKTTSRIAKIESYPELDTKNVSYLMRVADSYRERFLYYKAVDKYQEVLADDPKNAAAYNGLGLSYLEVGEIQLAGDAFKKTLEIDGANQLALDSLKNIESGNVAALAKAADPALADSATSQSAHDTLTEAVMTLEGHLDILLDTKDKTAEHVATINYSFDQRLDTFSNTAKNIADYDQERNEVLQGASAIFSSLFNSLTEAQNISSEIYSLAQEGLKRGRIALFRMERGPVTADMAAQAKQLAGTLKQYDDSLPAVSRTINEVVATSNDLFEGASRSMNDLTDSLNETDPNLLTIRTRAMLDIINSMAADANRLQDSAESAIDGLDKSSTQMKRAALNLNTLALSANEDRIYRKMFERRFKLDEADLASMLALGFGFGDALVFRSQASMSGETPKAFVEKFNKSGKTIDAFIADQVGANAKPDRGVQILLALADMDLRALTRNSPEIKIEAPADLDASGNIVNTDGESLAAEPELQQAYDSIMKSDPDKAIQIISDRGASKPATALSHKLLGLAYKNKGMYDEAAGELKNAVKKSDNDYQAHLMYANAFEELERYDDALNEYRSAYKINPDYGQAHLGAAYALYMNGREKEAEGEFRDAIRTNADPVLAHRDLGLLYYAQGRFYEALDQFDSSLKAGPAQPELQKVVSRLK